MKSRLSLSIVVMLCAMTAGMLHAAQAPPEPPQTRSAESWVHLETLLETIEATRQELRELRQEMRAAEDERERAGLARQVEQRSQDLESLQTAWEMLAVGNVDLEMFGVRTESAFDWREELQSVFEPILLELRRLTERPRRLERLRGERAWYRERVEAAESALRSITAFRENAPTAQLRDGFAALEQRWQRRHQDLSNRLSLVEFELEQTMAPAESTQDPMDRLTDMLSGRVLNLVIAVLVMVGVYLLMRTLARLYDRHVLRRSHERGVFAARVGILLFYLFTSIMVVLSGMTVFYVRGDWLLLGLMLILLAGAALAAQRSLPRFLTEARLMLNLGPVREGERLMFNGLPWRVKTLGMYATLENPVLQGGLLTLPLRMLVDYQSRRFTPEEPWFPAGVGDYVLLADGTYGRVNTLTPELVQILSLGSLKSYLAANFLGQAPRNLSNGFTLVVRFGLDYQHQAEITTSIREQLATEVSAGLTASEFGSHMTWFGVEFAGAEDSSLELAIIAAFDGEVADRYYRIQRLIQRLAVETCNRNDWVIPFTQLTVHMPSGQPTS